MSEQRFVMEDGVLTDLWKNKEVKLYELEDILNEQQSFIDLLFNELVEAQKQGYVVNFLHKNEHCSLIPKEIYDE